MPRNCLPVLDLNELEDWFRPSVNHLKDELRVRYQNAVAALTAVLTGTSTLTAAAEANHLCRKRLKSMAIRAPKIAPDGQPFGYRVCVPWGTYCTAETQAIPTMPRRAGPHAMTMMLRCQPRIAEWVEGYCRPLPPGRPPKSFERLHAKMVAELKRLDLSQFYPLNTDDQGRRALLRHLRRQRIDGEGSDVLDVLGGDSAASSSLWDAFRGRPFDRTEFDEHRIDIEAVMSVALPNGGIAKKKITMLWLLAEVEVESRAIVSWLLRVGRACNNHDVADCLARGLQPWQRRELAIPGLEYAPGAGMPAGLSGAAGALRSRCVAMDNAKSHHALDLEQAFCRAHDGVLLLGRPHQPRSRPIVEQLFSRLEQGALRMIAGGFEPATRLGDDKVSISGFSPEEHPVQLHLLEELIDVIVANYNATPHPALGSLSPLQYLQMRSQKLGWSYTPGDREVGAREMGSVLMPVAVKGNYKDKVMPHVNYLYVKYRSSELDNRWELVGKPLYARIYRNDLRTMVLYETATKPIGVLRAAAPWAHTRHDETTRKLVHQWSKQPGGLKLVGVECAIQAYMAFLRANAASSQQAVDQLARLQQQHPTLQAPPRKPMALMDTEIRAPRRGWVSLDRKPLS